MRRPAALVWSFALFLDCISAAPPLSLQRALPLLPLGLWHRLNGPETRRVHLVDQTRVTADAAQSLVTSYTLETPISHFPDGERYHPHVNGSFHQRYWFDARYFKPHGPTFILLGGETSGEDRLPFLETGILPILAAPTGGLSVVLEHRYYGASWPTANLSTDNMRFLDTAQSLADLAYFIEHANLPGIGRITGPVIVYGGSYAGAQAAFARKTYPKLVHGAIASSAVTTAIEDYSAYFEAIRLNAPPTCVESIVESIEIIDALLSTNKSQINHVVKSVFGLPNITDDRDFGNALSFPLSFWQARNWDANVSTAGFQEFCDVLSARTNVSDLSDLAPLLDGVSAAGALKVANYAKYTREHIAPLCPSLDQDECFATHDTHMLQRADREQGWRSWAWQTCTEWGYWMPAPTAHIPSLISRLITIDYIADLCPLIFPDGEHVKVPKHPDTDRINRLGNYSLAYDRLAFIDGSADPWRGATPHADEAPERLDTPSRPFKLIKGAVHHWDEVRIAPSSTLRLPCKSRRTADLINQESQGESEPFMHKKSHL